jgi:DNA-directed RNA polymerase-3 subunit RPC5
LYGSTFTDLTLTLFAGSDIMDKQILQSTRALSDTSKYAVAVYHDGELHITPLRGIVHLRPSFIYLDKSDKRAKEEAKEHGEGKYHSVSAAYNVSIAEC